jgi:hypothetical protein
MIIIAYVDLLHGNFYTEHLGTEWQVEVLVKHRMKTYHLFRFIVSIDRRQLDELVELGVSQLVTLRLSLATA